LNESRRALLIAFQPFEFTIDPTLVAGSLPVDASRYSIQRKTFFDGERYWGFWYDGTTIKYASSLDGVTWSIAYSDVPGMPSALTSSFTLANYGKTVALLWLQSSTWVYASTGQVKGDWIRWDGNQPQPLSVLATSGPIAGVF